MHASSYTYHTHTTTIILSSYSYYYYHHHHTLLSLSCSLYPPPSRTKLSSLISGITPPTTPLTSPISPLPSPPISMYFTAAATVALTSASRDTNLLFISGTNTDGLTNDNRPTHSETTLRVPSSCDWLLRKRVDQMGRARGERREEDDWRII